MRKTIKKLIYMSLVIGTVMPLMASSVQATSGASTNQQVTSERAVPASGDVEINATNFPDANFRSYLTRHDTDGNGKLSPTEIAGITILDMNNISDITGIKLLTKLKFLTIENSSISQLDLRGMTSLTDITYDNNNPNLKELDLRDCPNLVSAVHSTHN